jgi:hypothetical protein
MKLDKRVERNTQSVIALADLLREIIQNPASFTGYSNLFDRLKSQGELAKFSDESRGIYASSLNTVKRIAENALEGGFDALDRLRTSSLNAIMVQMHKKSRSNKIDKVGLRKRVKELEVENQLLRQDMLLLTYVLEKSLSQGHNYASNAEKPMIRTLCEKEQRELRDMLSLRERPPLTSKPSSEDA